MAHSIKKHKCVNMTEREYQATREIMRQANVRRGKITAAKANIDKYEYFVWLFSKENKPLQQAAAQENYVKAIVDLEKAKISFANLELPKSYVTV